MDCTRQCRVLFVGNFGVKLGSAESVTSRRRSRGLLVHASVQNGDKRLAIGIPGEHRAAVVSKSKKVYSGKRQLVHEEQSDLPPVRSVLAYAALVTVAAAALTVVMRGKLPALFQSAASPTSEEAALPRESTSRANVVAAQDFAPGYKKFRISPFTPLQMELGQKVMIDSNGLQASATLASKRDSSTVEVILPSSGAGTGWLSEPMPTIAVAEQLGADSADVSLRVIRDSGLRYDGQDMEIQKLAFIVGTSSAIASACVQVTEILEDQDTSVQEVTLVAYCDRAEDYGESLSMLESLERRFPGRIDVRCTWTEEDEETVPEKLIIDRVPPWSSNSIAVILGPKLFHESLFRLVIDEALYPEESVLVE
ncbi:hypothetical protein NDN08_006212 [Rhodosorus marinus]|uniref:FAD-binding FR-type domain-containing protein n=1 Tax=Rhodosorus marinus TaxID=101924 RepID=A0AAV8UNW1_9RHOD|nr:hypothetical protein NDN08_006212 [Rhodosorus marinus]